MLSNCVVGGVITVAATDELVPTLQQVELEVLGAI